MQVLLEGFTLGNAAILTNVCLLPLYPGLIAFMLGGADEAEAQKWKAAWLGVLVLAGVLTMMLLIGWVLYSVDGLIQSVPTIAIGAYIVVFLLGVMMLAGYNPFVRLNTVQAPVLNNRFATAYLYGLLLAPMTLPCTGPILIAALARGVAGDAGTFTSEILFFLAFGVGFGWPMLVLPLFAIPLQRQFIGWTTRNHVLLTRAAGLLLVVIAVVGLWVERDVLIL